MADTLAVESKMLDHSNGISDRQAAIAFGERIKARADEIEKTSSEIGRLAGIKKQSMTGYWNGERLCGSDKLFALADALRVRARWLVSGDGPKLADNLLMDVGEAEWISVPKYDLRGVTDVSIGEALMHVPMRRDWLNATFRVSTGLWLTRLLSEYRAANLDEGMLVICRTIARTDLSEGHVCVWRFQGSVVIGRFSVVPDAMAAGGGAGVASGYATHGSNLIVSPSQIGDDDDHYHLVGRVLGVFIRPI